MKKINKPLIIVLSICAVLTIHACGLIPGADISVNSDLENNGTLKQYEKFPKTKTLGIKWTKYTDEISGEIAYLKPPAGMTPADMSVCDPCVIKVKENDYRMWYTGIKEEEPVPGGLLQKIYTIGYAVSTDGINWVDKTTPQNVPVISHNLTSIRVSSVVKTDSGNHTYRMWYQGKESVAYDTNWNIYYAYTNSIPDDPADTSITWKTERFGKNFRALEPTHEKFDSASLGRVCVLYEKTEGYKMWYGGTNGSNWKIGYAASSEGKFKWVKNYEIMSPGFAAKNTFDRRYINYPYVIKDDGIYKMWYAGYDIPWEIGLAYSLDGEKFIYYDEQFTGSTNSSVLEPEVYWEGRGVSNICVIIDTDDKGKKIYKMWYSAEGNDKKFRLGYATSR